MTIDQIIEACRLGGVTLEQWLSAVSFSSNPNQQREERLIMDYLTMQEFLKLTGE